jgi:uridine phosphorylase
MLEEAIALGCEKFVACGGAGALRRNIHAGTIVVPLSAVRDEGTSYHYLPPSREVKASPEAIQAIEIVLQNHCRDYITAKTWTTDAPYRETRARIQLRLQEGCSTVEMEAAAFFAVARFRNVFFGQLLYAGDDVSGDTWDPRGWGEPIPVREELFWLAVESCLSL